MCNDREGDESLGTMGMKFVDTPAIMKDDKGYRGKFEVA